jgi:3-hydroxyisobutyrate dehydrogenase-like beta-hydroxyacid dehydrogenase
MQDIAFIGLGVMGYQIAGHLAAQSYRLSVVDRLPTKADEWIQQHSGDIAESVAQAVAHAHIVITCVGDDEHLREVFWGERGVLSTIRPGTLVIDHTTASAQIARQLEDALGEKGARFVDAPVSGGQQGAEQGCLSIMCGGHPASVQQAQSIIACYARKTSHMGPAGSGQLTKMVDQICVAGILQGLSEALLFAESAGLERDQVLRAISRGAAQSWQMDQCSENMLADQYQHGFAVDWMRKDLKMSLEQAVQQGVSLPVTALIDQFYADVQNMGGGGWDSSALLARLRKQAGLK